MPRFKLIAVLLAAVGLAACSGGQVKTPAPVHSLAKPQPKSVPGDFGLGAPAQYAGQLSSKPRHTSYVPADLLKQAEDVNIALPNSRVTKTANGLRFSPNWVHGTSGLAFAMYNLTIPDYEGDSSINYAWITAPPNPAQTYFGLANWNASNGAGRWDWFEGNAAGKSTFTDPGAYFDISGNMLIVVVQMGTAASELDNLRIGSLPPAAALSLSRDFSFPGTTVDFDASASTDPDGTIAEYKWDPEGDGTFETSSGTDPHFSFSYSTPGDFNAAVEVIDNDGVHNTAAKPIKISNLLNLSYGTAANMESAKAAYETANGHLLLFGNGERDFVGHVVVASVSVQGTTDFCKSWGDLGDFDDNSDEIADAARDADGSVYACGQTTSFGSGGIDALLQHWSPDGQLLWSKAVGTLKNEILEGIIIGNGNLYVCGEQNTGGNNRVGLIAKFDLDGKLLWTRVVNDPLSSSFLDIAYVFGIQTADSIKVCGGYDGNAIMCSLSTDGALLGSNVWDNSPDSSLACSVCVKSGLVPAIYLLGRTSVVNKGVPFMGRPGGKVFLVTCPQILHLNASVLRLGGLGTLTAALNFQSSSSLKDGLALIGLDSTLGLGEADSFVNDTSGDDNAFFVGSYESTHLLVGGDVTGALPAPVNFSYTEQQSAAAWTSPDLTLTSLPVVVTIDTDTALSDVTATAFDTQTDGEKDMLIIAK